MNRVIVVSRYWPTALSVVRSLGSAGYPVDLVSSAPRKGEAQIARDSKYVDHFIETVCENVKKRDDPGLLDALLQCARHDMTHPETRQVLFPTDDYTASFIDRHRNTLEQYYIMPSAGDGGQGAVTSLMSKRTQSRLASESGLLCPREWIVSLSDNVTIPDDMVYPCFCKPLESISGFKGEMAKCSSPEELMRHLRFLKSRNPNREFLVQEYLDIEEEIDISGVCIHDRVIIPGILRKTGTAYHERGVATDGRMCDPRELGKDLDSIIAMLQRCNYVGMFDMDLHIAKAGVFFGELNLRSGGHNYAYFLNGVNLPAIAVQGLMGEEVAEEACEIPSFGRTFVNEKVIWKEYLEGYASRNRLNRALAGADDHLIISSDDPAPGQLFEKNMRRDLRKRRKKRVRNGLKRCTRPLRTFLRGYPQSRPGNSRKRSNCPRVMVIGKNFSSNLCMARSLGMAGYDVEVFRIVPRKKQKDPSASLIPDAYSKYVKAFYTCPQLSGKIAARLKSLADSKGRMLLIPTEDVAAYIIDEHLDELREFYYVPEARDIQGEIIRLMGKSYQKELALQAGLPSPKSWLIRIEGGKYTIPDGVVCPCFMKPDVSRRTSKKRMRRCDTREELNAALKEIAEDSDLDILVEEYCETEKELSLLGLRYQDICLCPGLFEAVDEGHGARRGVAVSGRSIPCSEIDGLMDGVRRFMELTGYNGLFDIDFIKTTEGRIVFIELNLRYGASGFVLTESGVNLPGILADRIVRNKPVDPSVEVNRTGVTFVSEKALVEEYQDGTMTREAIHDIIQSTNIHFIKNSDDPKPYRHFAKAYKELF